MKATKPKNRSPKRKKPSKTQLRKRCDALARKRYRKDYCEAAGLVGDVKCGGMAEWCHLETRAILGLRYQEWNQITMCSGHHRYLTNRPVEWNLFLAEYFPEKLAKVQAWIRAGIGQFEGYEVWLERLKEPV